MAERLFKIEGNTKSCTRCLVFKPFSEFSANRFLECGLQSHCKVCKAFLLAERRKDPAYRQKLRERARLCQPQTRKRRRANRIADMLEQAKARAKRKGIPFDLSRSDLTIPAVCPVFGVPFVRGTDGNPVADGKLSPWSPSLDCIIPSLGYVRGNVQVISLKANTMKSNATPDQLRQFAQWVLSESAEGFNGQCAQLKAVA